jgi:hypothetical protein
MSHRKAGAFHPPTNIAAGDYDGLTVIHKFGHNEAVSTSFVPVTSSGIYRTPQVSGATALRVKAGGHADDTAAGDGAREITLEGLDETGALVQEAVATAGASASSATTTTFLRLFRAWVSASGTYASASAGSHTATITIEKAAGSEDWATLVVNGFAQGQTEIAAYTVPLGKRAFIQSIQATVDSNKTATILGFHRENILETAAPYTAMRMFLELGGVSGQADYTPIAPLGPFPALTDFGFMARVVATTAEVDMEFEILLEDLA